MAGQRQPIELVIANGKKHLTKDEIAQRRAVEVQPCTDDLSPPSYLTAAQKTKFTKLVAQLCKIKIMGETDTDAVARFVTSQTLYELAVKDLRDVQKQRPKDMAPESLAVWAAMLDRLDKRVARYFNQAQSAARDLGLTISARCKIQVPTSDEPEKPVNKFTRFSNLKAAGAE